MLFTTSPWSQRAARRTAAFLTMAVAIEPIGCGKTADAHADIALAESAARVDGDHLVLAPNDPRIVTLATAMAMPATADSLRVPGRLAWDEDVTVRVFSPLSGRVARVMALVGRRVQAEDTLALIASPDFGQAQADAHRAATDFALAERTVGRMRDLLQHGVVAQKDVEAAEADVARARTELQRAQARLALYGGDTASISQMFPLRAPIGGTVVERSVTPGQEVRPDQMLANAPQLFAPLFVVTDPARLWVILDVPERDLPLIITGSPIGVKVTAWPDRVFPGRLTSVSGAVDASTRTIKVRGAVRNSRGLLKAEMLATVSLSSVNSGGVVVPSAAVLLEGGDHIVYVDEGKGTLRRTRVTVGTEHQGTVQVRSGLSPGERIVTSGALLFEQLFQESMSRS
jgi:cobalt-zinc-cadmium efflux system membrane fusion protein